MNKSQIITAIVKRHGAAFIGLTREQHAALHNAMGAAYTAGNEARPDYEPPEMVGPGFHSEALTPEMETTRRALELAGPVPQDDDAFLVYLDRVDTLKREGAMACACEAVA